MKTMIVAIPMFDSNMAVKAYKLCGKNGAKMLGLMKDYREMEEVLVSPGLNLVNKLGVEPFTGGLPLFADINEYQLLMGVPMNMKIAPSQLVCVLPKDIPQNVHVMERCTALKEAGYSLALDGVEPDMAEGELMDMVDYLLCDANMPGFNSYFKKMLPHYRKKQVVFTGVPDMAMFKKLNNVPNAICSGTFYNQPLTVGTTGIAPVKVNALQLLNQVNEADFELTDIAKTIERDPSISISLLRFINSPAVGVRQRIDSIRSAVAILGQKEVKRWVTVAVSVQLAEDRPGEITKLSLVRAKFAENLATGYEMGVFAPSLFMAGLFSLLDVILEMPMEDAINEVAVDARVRSALVDKEGPLYEVLDLIYSYERADWDKVSINLIRNNIEVDALNKAFIDALIWYKELLMDIDESEEAVQQQGSK
ncbi:HDOD domain-containing protein [Clostridia bacterium OttesenSCG-928-F22]|nr:HDOD domain-containing protein [Clostridia bacterium OttesenSCG-928-F22]